ncbi:MAG TPA: electron transfer flavoprotein subunit alpha/FixB family protein [Candidatus Limnocylindrales bacterium]|nr:electron transfer flavoprotein subunit alpha/FixB family protein [Candidatus Limnocylindrales bacterium]
MAAAADGGGTPGIWVIAETNPDGSLAKTSAELATLARTLADGAGTGATTAGIVVAPKPGGAARELATYLPRVIAVVEPVVADHAWGQPAAARIAEVLRGDPAGVILAGAGPDGRDAAGTLLGLLDGAVLVNATAVSWGQAGPQVEMGVFGGRLITTSTFAHGGWKIVTVRPNVVTAVTAASAGSVEMRAASGDLGLPAVRVVDRIEEAGAAVSIDDARIIVAGGRGVGGPEGFQLVQRIADRLGGAVGATRAAVDAGWVPYAQQIGQTGKIVKPQLYLALGISGAIQHKVGMQTAGTIVAVNRDPDAPIAEFADLIVIGDLFEVGRALVEELGPR